MGLTTSDCVPLRHVERHKLHAAHAETKAELARMKADHSQLKADHAQLKAEKKPPVLPARPTVPGRDAKVEVLA